ncbi:NAD(P)-dependent dehydrogenase (short-subunit alcohol dehydrogenase family) [Yoonia maricola]|uniref:NAD(P)-dependent dehydrogenase (Short-subunit alcohol dehydrogenase family) n=1 Tax=Yoonia maricola TaxID=420999 RepID=A0A2M8WPP7_9RHOB|nr:SDR family oxidoreductase [Yoonia maricola]PJI92909.1 NAD(P)-dependent dehydrogenase (short-subunit alcohol dehydrogenase family) [Yoonia maricola]
MKDQFYDSSIETLPQQHVRELSDEAWGQRVAFGRQMVSDVTLREGHGLTRRQVLVEALCNTPDKDMLHDPLCAARYVSSVDSVDLRRLLPVLLFHGTGTASWTLTVKIDAVAALCMGDVANAERAAFKAALTRATQLPVFDNIQDYLSAGVLLDSALCLQEGWYIARGLTRQVVAAGLADVVDKLVLLTGQRQLQTITTSQAIADCRADLGGGKRQSVVIWEEDTGHHARATAHTPQGAQHRLSQWQFAKALAPSDRCGRNYDLPPCTDIDRAAVPFLGHCAIVTGASSGIGRATAIELAGLGANVFAADIDTNGLEALSEGLEKTETPLQGQMTCDMSDEDAVKKMMDAAVTTLGGLDHVVSNAGRGSTGFLRQMNRHDWDVTLAQNATSHFFLTQWALDYLEKQGMGGAIVYIASKTAVAPGPGFGAYAIAKAAELQLARVAAIEGGAFGVRANVVNPGAIFSDSKFWTQDICEERSHLNAVPVDSVAKYYADRNLLCTEVKPDDVARAVTFLLSDNASKTTGCILTVDGGDDGAFPR